jgi:hypothetical protein
MSTPTTDSEDDRVKRAAAERERRRAAAERRKSRRTEAIESGRAKTVTPEEYSAITGVSIATVYRRVADGALRHKRLASKDGAKKGPILIFADQLG